MATLSHNFLNDELINLIQSILNLDNNMINLNLLNRKRLEKSWKTTRIHQINMPLILMFLHKNHTIVFPNNHLFKIQVLAQGKNPIIMITETDAFSPVTIVLDLSIQTIVKLLFTIHIIQNITRAFLLLYSYKTST